MESRRISFGIAWLRAGDEGVDGLGEVFVGAGFVAGDEGGGDGHDFFEVEIVEGEEEGVGGEGELEDDEAAAGFEDAGEFGDRVLPVGDVSDAEGDGEDVGGGGGEGEGEGVALEEGWGSFKFRVSSFELGFFLGDGEHFVGEVDSENGGGDGSAGC